MLYMIIETFPKDQVAAIYARLAERGRMLPEGLVYIDSWVASDRSRCFQLMATDDERLLGAWIEKWADLVVFEIVPVVPSLEMQSRLSAPK